MGCLVVGVGLLMAGLPMPRLRDESRYQERYGELGLQMEDDERFVQLRREFRTGRQDCENYGITLLMCGLIVPAATTLIKRWKSLLTTRWSTGLLGSFACVMSVSSMAAEILLDHGRGEYPWWNDCLVSRLGALVPGFIVLGSWMTGHWLLAGSGPRRARTPGFTLIADWLWLSRLLAGFALGCALVSGNFLSLGPGALWLLFHSALLRNHLRTGTIICY
jgi:hypothetical protein